MNILKVKKNYVDTRIGHANFLNLYMHGNLTVILMESIKSL